MQVEPFHRGMHRGNDQQVVSRHFAERHRTGQRAEHNDPFGIDRLPDRPDDPAELAGIVTRSDRRLSDRLFGGLFVRIPE